jgi:uncharacterized protein with GYD domain
MKVIFLANYAANGLIQGSDREAAVKALVESVGGKVQSMMFTRGAYDILPSTRRFLTRLTEWVRRSRSSPAAQ